MRREGKGRPGAKRAPLGMTVAQVAVPFVLSAILAGCPSPRTAVPDEDTVPVVEAVADEAVLAPLARIRLEGVQVSVSGQLGDYGSHLLMDNNPSTFWHVKTPKQMGPAWILVDLGEDRALPVEGVEIIPREGHANLLWTRPAALQGSSNGRDWDWLAYLSLNKARMQATGERAVFPVSNQKAYRYYRLFIDARDFYAMGEFELFGKGPAVSAVGLLQASGAASTAGGRRRLLPNVSVVLATTDDESLRGLTRVPLGPEQLRASSQLGAHGPDLLVDGNPGTFWHTDLGPPPRTAWLLMDVKVRMAVRALRVVPRTGQANQLWNLPVLLEGSQSPDGRHWQPIVYLHLDKRALRGSGAWAVFSFANQRAYRHYRLVITEDLDFYSIGEIELYAGR